MAEESSEALAMAATSASSETMRFGASASSDQSYSEIKIVRKAQDDETMRFGGGAPRTRRRIAREGNSASASASYASCLSPESAEGENCGEMSSASCSTSCGEEEGKDRVGKSVVDPEEVEVESALTTSKNLDSPSAASMERVSIIISDRDMAISTSMRESYKIGDRKSDEQESTRRNLDANPTVQIKMPSDSLEIEEFFAAAEKNLHKRFSEKYNFDVVKDVPLEGRYEWVPLKP